MECFDAFMFSKLRRILRPGIAIHLKFADLSIIRVWTCSELCAILLVDYNQILWWLSHQSVYNKRDYKTSFLLCTQLPNVNIYRCHCHLSSVANHICIVVNIPFIFLLGLLFDLSYRGLQFASTTNLEARPRFADIWCLAKKSDKGTPWLAPLCSSPRLVGLWMTQQLFRDDHFTDLELI